MRSSIYLFTYTYLIHINTYSKKSCIHLSPGSSEGSLDKLWGSSSWWSSGETLGKLSGSSWLVLEKLWGSFEDTWWKLFASSWKFWKAFGSFRYALTRLTRSLIQFWELRLSYGCSDWTVETQIEPWELRLSTGGSDRVWDAFLCILWPMAVSKGRAWPLIVFHILFF